MSGEKVSLRPFRGGLFFGAFNAVTWQVALGTPLVLLSERLGADASQVGMMYAFFYLLVPFQLVATSYLPRFGFQKVFMFGFGMRGLFLVVPLGLAFLSGKSVAPWMMTALMAAMFFFCLFRAVGSCAYIPWMYSILPREIRGRYFATDQLFSGFAGILTLLVSSVLFWWFSDATAFQLLFGLSALGSALAVFSLSRLEDGPRPDTLPLGTILKRSPGLVFRSGPFSLFILINVLFTVLSAPVSPFTAFFLKAQGALDSGRILLYTMLQTFGGIGMSLIMRYTIDKVGAKVYMVVSLLLYCGIGSFWLLYLNGFDEWVAAFPLVYFVVGMAGACWLSGVLNFMPKLIPDDERPLYTSVFSALGSFLGGLSPLFWGLLMRSPGGGTSLTGFRVFFCFVLVSSLLVLSGLLKIKEPDVKVRPMFRGGANLRIFRFFGYLMNPVVRKKREEETNSRES